MAHRENHLPTLPKMARWIVFTAWRMNITILNLMFLLNYINARFGMNLKRGVILTKIGLRNVKNIIIAMH